MTGERVAYIDYLKCFTICLVVWGHTIQSFGINSSVNCFVNFNIILTFHMPLFAIMSGFLFKSTVPWVEFLKKKMTQLIVPYFVWCVVAYWLIPSFSHPVGILDFFGSFIYEGWWFIRGLLLCFVLAFCTERICPKYKSHSLVVSVFVFLLLGWSGIIPNMDSPLKDVFFLYPFFVCGVLLRGNDDFIQCNRRKIFFGSALIFLGGLFFWNGWEDTFYEMNTSVVEKQGYEGIVGIKVIERSLLRFLMGISGSLLFYLVFQKFEKKIGSLRISSLLSDIGKISLCVYFLQYFVFAYISPRNLFAHQELVIPLCLMISIVIVLLSYSIFRATCKSKVLSLLLWGKVAY